MRRLRFLGCDKNMLINDSVEAEQSLSNETVFSVLTESPVPWHTVPHLMLQVTRNGNAHAQIRAVHAHPVGIEESS